MDKYRSRGTLSYEISEKDGKLGFAANFTPDTEHYAKHDEGEFAVFVSDDENGAIGRRLKDKNISIKIDRKWRKVIHNFVWNKAFVEITVEGKPGESEFRLAGVKIPTK